VGCVDGAVWRRVGDRWTSLGRVPDGGRLTVGDDLWSFGSSGLWRHVGGERWRRVEAEPVLAAAASGGAVATSNGVELRLLSDGAERPSAGRLEGVRDLAWQGAVLWATTSRGLYHSGGALLPWRRGLVDLEGLAVLAGAGDRLWLILNDGTLLQHVREPCGEPFATPADGGGLAEPRDLAVSARGFFVVADTLNHRVVSYGPGGSCLDSFGGEGALPGQFRQPSGLALSQDGTLAVADTWNSRLQVLRRDGVVEVVAEGLYGPRDALWLPDGSLLVADTGNGTLVLLRPPTWQRREVARFGVPVVGLVRVDALVAAALPVAAQVVLLEPSTWEEVRRLEVPGWEGGSQQEGYLLALPDGSLLASAPEAAELWRLDPSGVVPPVLERSDLPGVTGLALLPDGRILASQTWSNRLITLEIE
jgi:sugar lactone lactonase YvrE